MRGGIRYLLDWLVLGIGLRVGLSPGKGTARKKEGQSEEGEFHGAN